MPAGVPPPVQNHVVLPQFIPFYMVVLQFLLLPASLYKTFGRYLRPADVPPGAREDIIDVLAQQRTDFVLHYLLTNFPAALFESNFGRMLVQATGGVYFQMRVLCLRWVNQMVEYAVGMYNEGNPLFQNVEPPLSDFTIIRAVRQMLEQPSLHDDIVVSLERYLRTLEERTVQAEGRQAMDQAVQQGAQQQQQPQQTTPVRTDLTRVFARMKETVSSFLTYAKARTSGIAQPALFLQALNLYITTVADLVGRERTATSPNQQDSLAPLITYYNEAVDAFNRIQNGASMDDREMARRFLSDPDTTRGIMGLAENLSGLLGRFVSEELNTVLFARPSSLWDFLVSQWSLILSDFKRNQPYTLNSKPNVKLDKITNYP
jgi:hypothetical protein